MSDRNSPAQHTFEQLATLCDDLAGWSAQRAIDIAEALEASGASAAERLSLVRQNHQASMTTAIERRERALVAADAIAESVWRQAIDEVSCMAVALDDETKDAAARLASFQDAAHDSLRRMGRFVVPVLGAHLPDGWWHMLEGFAFGEGASRLDPTGVVYVSMLLHRIDNTIGLSGPDRWFDPADSAGQGRAAVALLNALGQLFRPTRPPLSDSATNEQLISYAGRIAIVTDAFGGGLRLKASLPTANDARLDFGAFLALHQPSPFVVTASHPAVQAKLNALWQHAHRELHMAWASDRQDRRARESHDGQTRQS